jgi:hypothetical protein
MRTGAVVERSSFDERPEEPVEDLSQERAEWEGEETYPVDGQIPQAQIPVEEPVPTARNQGWPFQGDQASKPTQIPPVQTGPGLRRGPNRAVALRPDSQQPEQALPAGKIIEEERMRAEFGTAKPVAGQIK